MLVANFAKTADKLEIKAGVVEGNYYDAKGMTAIANVPSREVLLGRLLGSMNSPIANFARVINQIADRHPRPGRDGGPVHRRAAGSLIPIGATLQ